MRAAERWWKTFAGKDFKKPDVGYKKVILLLSSDAVSCISGDIFLVLNILKNACLGIRRK